jgi:hypothetical protein
MIKRRRTLAAQWRSEFASSEFAAANFRKIGQRAIKLLSGGTHGTTKI